MNSYEALGELAAACLLLPLTRRWSVRWTRRRAHRIVSAAARATVKRWAAGPRFGRFAFAYSHGLVCGTIAGAAGLLIAQLGIYTPIVAAMICAGFYGADWGAQFWSAREARIRELTAGEPLPELETAAPAASVPAPLPAEAKGDATERPLLPPGLISGLSILAGVFSVVIALAGYQLKSQPAVTASRAAGKAPAPTVASAPVVPPPPAVAPPPLVAREAAPPPAAIAPDEALVIDPGPDLRAVLRRMNDEANELMPNTLPLPIPEDQYQDLAGKFQKIAAKYFPDLAVKGSALNLAFVARYTRYREDNPTFFDQPDWPVQLTEECVGDVSGGKSVIGADPLPSP